MPEAGFLIHELPAAERPRERLLGAGPGALSDGELVAVLLRTGVAGRSALGLATELLAERGGLPGLLDAGPADLRRGGLGPAKTASLLAAVELARRLARREMAERAPMDRPAAVARYLEMRFARRGQEVVGAVFLDSRNRLLGEAELYRGTLSRALVEPREVLREALARAAAGMVFFHTHPSGDPTPSAEDLTFTRRLAEAGELIGVTLVDHLVLGHGGRWVSLRQRGAW